MSDAENPPAPAPSGHRLPAGKNPFVTFADWDDYTLAQIKIIVTDPEETTGDFTRKQSKNGRFWKSLVTFSFGAFTSETLKISNVQIPYVDKPNYGVGFVYGSVNQAVGRALKKAAFDAGVNVNIDDERVVSTKEEWWKTINKVEGNFGSVGGSQPFTPKDMTAVFAKTAKKGLQVQAELSFFIKYSTMDGSDRTALGTHRISVEASKLFIKGLRVDVQPPTTLKKSPAGGGSAKPGPSVVSRSDVAPDDVLAELADLGI